MALSRRVCVFAVLENFTPLVVEAAATVAHAFFSSILPSLALGVTQLDTGP